MKEKSLLKKIINESKKHKLLLSVYDDRREVDNFYVGYVVEVFEDSILLDSFNENGDNDGCILIRLVDIFKIEKGSTYLKNLAFITNQLISGAVQQQRSFKEEGKDGIVDVISACRKNKILVTVKLIYTDYIIGFITEEDEERYLIETYSKNGMCQGYSLIEYKDIQNIHFEGKEEKNILKLIER
jgi:hypothetical protein